MSLYKLFTTPVEIQYKGYFLSKAMLFIIATALMTIILPFIIAYRSRGFWLKSHYFYEQPVIRPTYDYLLIIDTDDPSYNIVCGEIATSYYLNKDLPGEEYCSETQIQEIDDDRNGKNDIIKTKFNINIPSNRNIVSILLFLALDFQITTICPLQMQSLIVVTKDFVVPPNELRIHGDLQLYQNAHLPCPRHNIDVRYNDSIFKHEINHKVNIVDYIFETYSQREVTTQITNTYFRVQNGKTGFIIMDVSLKIPEVQVRYKPSFLQELKWAWPQYLSLVVIFYWIFTHIKLFVFKNRFLMAWEIVSLKKKY